MKKVINFVDKKELIIITILTFLIALTGLFATYAIDTSLSYNDTTEYDMSLSFDLSASTNKQVTIPVGKTKFFDIDVKNSNSGTIQYGIAYSMVTPSTLPSGVTIAKSWKSANPPTGLINANVTLPVTIAVENTSSTDITISLSIINGYEKGGDLILPTGKTLISGEFDATPPVEPNAPALTDALIPILYEGDSIIMKADSKGDGVTATCDNLGDLNFDGRIDNNDVSAFAEVLQNGLTFPNTVKVCADVDGDGFVTEDDMRLIKKYFYGSVTTFPKGEPLSTVTGTVYITPWYDYDNKQWANAVLVSEANRQKYISADPGTEIAEEDILAFYVWIPRYKYKVWNKDKVIGTDGYDAYNTGVDIVFESGTSSTGTISCAYSYNEPSSETGSPNETCTGSNGDYYTHPAFTFGDQELTGFWMGKFELSSSNPATGSSYGGGNSTTLTPRILPNVTSWRYNTASNYWKVIYDMQTSNNIYGLPTSRTSVDSHMITNIEWGSVAYLTNSKYGRCTNGNCIEVSINGYGETKNWTTKTGCGPISSGSTSSGTTCNAYNTTIGQTASTTGNIYGVYDMSGGAYEYVMGNMSSSNGTSYTYYASSAGTNFTYSTDTAKYLIPYAYGTTPNDQTAYNRGRLGDATSEVVTKASYGWYNDYAYFPNSSSSWFLRGGGFSYGSYAGLFFFDRHSGTSNRNYSGRAALSIAS